MAVHATRAHLLMLKEQIRSAANGSRLLRSKREALLREFLSSIETVLAVRSALDLSCREGVNTLILARAREGALSLRSAALGAKRRLDIDISEKLVWGIPVPDIRYRKLLRSPDARGYGLAGTGLLVDETATAFEKILHQGLRSAIEEYRLRRIGDEIRRTSRRVNALEHILIPSLAAEKNLIVRALEERSREEVFRHKMLKRKKRKGP